MDIAPRSEIALALAKRKKKNRRDRGEGGAERLSTSFHRVVADNVELPILSLDDHGFTIAADGRPPLRGYVEIFHGDSRVDRRLVICDWADDGIVGYRFKRREAKFRLPAVDYVRSAISGLIEKKPD